MDQVGHQVKQFPLVSGSTLSSCGLQQSGLDFLHDVQVTQKQVAKTSRTQNWHSSHKSGQTEGDGGKDSMCHSKGYMCVQGGTGLITANFVNKLCK